MSSIVWGLGVGISSQLLFNGKIAGDFKVKRFIRQDFPLAPPLFAICTHPLVRALELEVAKGSLGLLVLPSKDELFIKLFVDDSLLFLKTNATILGKSLFFIQLFAVA